MGDSRKNIMLTVKEYEGIQPSFQIAYLFVYGRRAMRIYCNHELSELYFLHNYHVVLTIDKTGARKIKVAAPHDIEFFLDKIDLSLLF